MLVYSYVIGVIAVILAIICLTLVFKCKDLRNENEAIKKNQHCKVTGKVVDLRREGEEETEEEVKIKLESLMDQRAQIDKEIVALEKKLNK